MNYTEAKKLLTSQGKFHIKLGLERVQAVLKLLGNPQDKVKIIHVAGTNGKGSVCSIVANILKCAGYKVGLYTSPHLVEYTERIKINNEEISQQDFANYTEKICALADKYEIHLTEFEILTVMAYKYFADNKVKIAVIETGLGGRFDATNVTKKTFISVITSISLDHTDRLGDTIEKIAFEKAGIIKPKSIVITEISNKGFRIIRETAEKQKAKLIVATNYVDMNVDNGKNHIAVNGGKYEFNLLERRLRDNDYDTVVAFGEYLCAKIFASYLNFEFVDAKKLIYLDSNKNLNESKTKQAFERLMEKHNIVIPGFYGSTNGKDIVLLNRGGSDFSGAIACKYLGGECYENYSDVDGVYLCNPKIIKNKSHEKEI